MPFLLSLDNKRVLDRFIMVKNNLEQTCREILRVADIEVNGNRPWDIRVNNPEFYRRVLNRGSLGLGESYMDRWWDCDRLDEFFCRLLRANLEKKARSYLNLRTKVKIGFNILKASFSNQQNFSKSRRVAEQHYDLGNHLFEKMLGKTMAYSCGYWKTSKTLDEAQGAKFDLICRKLGLKPGMSVLDIGCGFGSFAEYAAKEYGSKVLGITLSKEQAKASIERCRGLDVEIRVQDYRQVRERFDRVVSIGMFEHVGPKNYRRYFQGVSACLADDGLFLLHTIGRNTSIFSGADPWINKYIFPGGHLPSIAQIAQVSEGLFVNEDLHNFGADYGRTLGVWHDNFKKNWQEIKIIGGYNERFKRMWDYYLLSCKGSFEARKIQLWQFVFSKKGVEGGYESIR